MVAVAAGAVVEGVQGEPVEQVAWVACPKVSMGEELEELLVLEVPPVPL